MEIYHYCRLPGLGVLYSFLMTSPIVFCPPFVISYVYTKQKTNSVGLLGFFSFFIQINRLAIILHRKLRVGWIASKPITGENPFRLVDLLTKLVDCDSLRGQSMHGHRYHTIIISELGEYLFVTKVVTHMW